MYHLSYKLFTLVVSRNSSNMFVRPLVPELKELAKNEINKVPSRIQDDIEHVRKWITKQPHLNARTGVILPKTADLAGPRVSIFRAKCSHPKTLSFESVFKTILMMLDTLLLDDDNFVVAGTHVILDLKGVSYNCLTNLTPSFIKKVIVFNQSRYPLRIKGVHVINAPSFLKPLCNTAKLVFNKKLVRFNIYSKKNMKELYNVIPLSILPKDYGGEERSMDELAIEYKSKFESYRDWFLEEPSIFRMRKNSLDDQKLVQKCLVWKALLEN